MPPREKIFKFFGVIFLIIFLTFFEVSFTALCKKPFNYLSLFLPVIFFISIIINYHYALWLGFLEGIILNIFSVFPFGSIALSLIVALAAMNFLFINFFTNKSLYSLIFLGGLGNLIYIFNLVAINFLFFIFGANGNDINKIFSPFIFDELAWQILFSIIFLIIFFYALNFFGKRAKRIST